LPAGTPSRLSEPDPATQSNDGPLVEVENLTINFPIGRQTFLGGARKVVHAVSNVSLAIERGETLGLVGESGSGKTTTGRAILRRVDPTEGIIRFKGRDITHETGEALRHLRRHMQLVFQDPYASLNPRMTVGELVAEPLVVHGIVNRTEDARDRVHSLLERCGLPSDTADRYPHAFSGGQRQRVGIARALALEPDFIVADEPVSALDVSVRAQVINLLQDLQADTGLTYLFIAHDLSVVRHISHRIAIMYAGEIVEIADRDSIYDRPHHPYTEALLSSVPVPDPPIQRERRRIVLEGEIPDPVDPPSGCRFASRCPLVEDRCRVEAPKLTPRSPTHETACWVR
jgi:oligopeptide/dipeptide ABC transporter ATP-binding protein